MSNLEHKLRSLVFKEIREKWVKYSVVGKDLCPPDATPSNISELLKYCEGDDNAGT